MRSKLTEGFFHSLDNTRLYYRMCTPAQETGRPLLLVHGYNEHCGRYAAVMEELASIGVRTLAFDLRGHGQSAGRRSYVRHVQDYQDDTLAAHALLKPASAPFLLGHSMGGLIATCFALAQPDKVRALVLSSPMFAIAAKVHPAKEALASLMRHLYPVLALPSGLSGNDMSSDPKVAESYDSDPLNGKNATAGWFGAMKDAMSEVAAKSYKLELPIYHFHGTGDVVTSYPASTRAFELFASKDKTFVSYEGFRHECLNEAGRARVLAGLLPWLQLHS